MGKKQSIRFRRPKNMEDIKTIPYPSPLPELKQDNLGRFNGGIAQDTDKNGTAGRPCKLCANYEELYNIAKKYIDSCMNVVEGKTKMPFKEELALLLKVRAETLSEWVKNKTEHPEFSDLLSTLQTLQSLRLQQRVLGRYNPTGPLALLKWHHGMIETSKQILAGDKSEPLTIEIIEEKVRDVE